MKFPKTLYVTMEKEGDTVYPIANTQLIDVAEIGETIRIGVYELREMTYVECQVRTTVRKK